MAEAAAPVRTAQSRPVPAPRAAAARTVAGPAAGAAAAKAPPAWLPAEHFAAALLFLLLGCAGAVFLAGDLVAANFLSPRVGALTHLFTLGWITTSIMGALYQFLPVALDEPIRSQRLAHATFLLYVPGLLAFVAGLATFTLPLLLAGAITMGTAVLLFIGNLTATLARAQRRDVTWWALALATAYLAVTLLLGLALTGNLKWAFLAGGRIAAIGVHLHVALAGWVLLVMIGVAHRLLPMFLLSHGAGDMLARIAVALTAAGAGMLALLHHAPPFFSYWLPALLIAGGCASFLAQARVHYVRRHRRHLDPGMRLAAGALLLLGATVLLGGHVVGAGSGMRMWTAYVMAAILGITCFVAAHYYRIVPFLVWYHRFGPLAGRRQVPRVSDLFSARLAGVAAAALLAGSAGLVVAVAAGVAAAATFAAALLLAGAAIMALQMLLTWRVQP
jgi:hypothetical protein